jgi:hypothetical protein
MPNAFAGRCGYLDPPRAHGLTYPAQGVAALWESETSAPGDLGVLLGGGRANVLRALAGPATTSQLVAQLGMLGGVGGPLAMLRRMGLVSRTRSGRNVLYRRTRSAMPSRTRPDTRVSGGAAACPPGPGACGRGCLPG